jgi:hypothetical protein
MEKDIGKIKKNANTDIAIRIDDFGGKVGLTIREFVTGERYSGFTKAGTRIPAEAFFQFRELINSIDYNEFMSEGKENSEVKSGNKRTVKSPQDIVRDTAKEIEEEIEEELF